MTPSGRPAKSHRRGSVLTRVQAFRLHASRHGRIELWIGDTATGRADARTGPTLNAVLGAPCRWVGQARRWRAAWCRRAAARSRLAPRCHQGRTCRRTAASRRRCAPTRTCWRAATTRRSSTYYATSQLALVDAATGQRHPVGKPAIYAVADRLAERRVRARLAHASGRSRGSCPTTTSRRTSRCGIAGRGGEDACRPAARRHRAERRRAARTARVSLACRRSRRRIAWVEALDGGDPKTTVPFRDKVLTLAAPFTAAADRAGPTGVALPCRRLDRGRHGAAAPSTIAQTRNDAHLGPRREWRAPRKLWERCQEDAYGDPGTSVARASPARRLRVVTEVDDSVYLTGVGIVTRGRSAVPRSPQSQDRAEDARLPDRRPAPTSRSSRCSPMTARGCSRGSRRAPQPPNVYARDPRRRTRGGR